MKRLITKEDRVRLLGLILSSVEQNPAKYRFALGLLAKVAKLDLLSVYKAVTPALTRDGIQIPHPSNQLGTIEKVVFQAICMGETFQSREALALQDLVELIEMVRNEMEGKNGAD